MNLLDEFLDFAEVYYPETGNVKRMCKNAGLNAAGKKISNEKKLYCIERTVIRQRVSLDVLAGQQD